MWLALRFFLEYINTLSHIENGFEFVLRTSLSHPRRRFYFLVFDIESNESGWEMYSHNAIRLLVLLSVNSLL